MSKILERPILDLRDQVDMFHADRYYEGKRRLPWWLGYLAVIPGLVGDHLARLVCKYRGHNMVDDSPPSCVESGRFDMVCTRCGASFGGYMTG
jgi:hypothetical protein